MEALVREADASSHSYPDQYAGLGLPAARLPHLAGVAIAAAQNAADLANADRAPGIFADGFVAARHGARQRVGAASGVVRGSTLVCRVGAFPRSPSARRRQT